MTAPKQLEVDPHVKAKVLEASAPQASSWVSANAGSGKTFVLTRRVVRLLLSGSEPSRLLCLTFTKAAAAEMSNRVFAELSQWAKSSDTDLSDLLTEVEGIRPTPKQMARARTLFAKALETPGGLKIQTIHAFCEALLHQFPLEANVPGSFEVMDDRLQNEQIEDARRSAIVTASNAPDTPLGIAFTELMRTASDDAIDKALRHVISQRETLLRWLSQCGGAQRVGQTLRETFGVTNTQSRDELLEQAAHNCSIATSEWEQLRDIANDAGKPATIQLAGKISQFLAARGTEERGDALKSILLAKGQPRSFKTYPSKPVNDALPGIRDRMEAEAHRLFDLLDRAKQLALIESTQHLLVFAKSILDRYQAAKRHRGLLDYDDLVGRTVDLLLSSDASAWVLYKLDLGIDHILLDEAQDTSPPQWQLIEALAEEFFSGESTRATRRTIFAVGDEKQSIYSFQGAAPQLFAQYRAGFAKRIAQADQEFSGPQFNLSFRSTPDVLAAVDRVFQHGNHAMGLTFGGDYPPHTAHRRHDPGEVEIWPFEMASEKETLESWAAVPDLVAIPHQAVRLARSIAADIADRLAQGRHEATGKRVQAGDILVLVRSRDMFIHALTRELKGRGIAVAGADRLIMTDHIAVMDLMAIGRVMLTPDDDLSLAAVLKSPLIGWDDELLLELCQRRFVDGRNISLFAALHAVREDAQFSMAWTMIDRWRRRAGTMPVFEFYSLLLGDDGGRRLFDARLGVEARDVIDAFLDVALGMEGKALPGLQHFLDTLAEDDLEIKRELDQNSGQVRVMTVHAAKGLEAPIVYLVDKGAKASDPRKAPALYPCDEDGAHVWVPAKAQHSVATERFLEAHERKEEDEYRRLLYVAMTRARDRLIVCGYCGKPNKDGDPPVKDPNWHMMVSSSLRADASEFAGPDGSVRLRWRMPDSPKAQPEHHDGEAEIDADETSTLPKWAFHKLPEEKALPRPLAPSGAQALIDESLADGPLAPSLLSMVQDDASAVMARRRGTAIHQALQFAPRIGQRDRDGRLTGWFSRALPDLTAAEHDELARSVQAVMNDPALRHLFDENCSRGEVSVMGRINLASGPRSISGTVDRMAITPERVFLADFKTTTRSPAESDDVPENYMTQMALYRSLISQIYPDRDVEAWLIWTHGPDAPSHTQLSAQQLDEALAAITGL
ncbi:MAG: double-strand break repair helicase AddA [Ahrensia sp.]|nr:double-strand break repair helicase AddA [Ahrensia sp.]